VFFGASEGIIKRRPSASKITIQFANENKGLAGILKTNGLKLPDVTLLRQETDKLDLELTMAVIRQDNIMFDKVQERLKAVVRENID
jgi:hypothetical protein